MSEKKRGGFFTRLLVRIVINAAAIYAAAWFLPGIHLEGLKSILIVAALFGLVNALIKPVVSLVTCLVQIITLGLFTLVINGAMLDFTAWLAQRLGLSFSIDNFLSALLGALIVSVASFVLSRVFR